MNRKRMNILLQSDERYAAVTGVCLTSLLENNRAAEEIHIYLINVCIGAENLEKFRSLAGQYGRAIEFLDMGTLSERLEAINAPKWFDSYAAYGRLFAPGMIGEDIDRILYLDSDTIVTTDLGALYNVELEGNVCAMVQDSADYGLYRQIGHRRDDIYFNSGVIVFDLPEWKRQKCEDAVFPFFRAFGAKLNFPDQDALNHLLKGKIKKLDIKYNYFVLFLTTGVDLNFFAAGLDRKPHYYSREAVRAAGENAAILHYTSSVKPWLKDTRCACVDQWDRYLRLSPWAGMEKTDKKQMSFRARIQEEIKERRMPLTQRALHLLYVYVVGPFKFRLRQRKAAK